MLAKVQMSRKTKGKVTRKQPPRLPLTQWPQRFCLGFLQSFLLVATFCAQRRQVGVVATSDTRLSRSLHS
jgi:hypothetical protein